MLPQKKTNLISRNLFLWQYSLKVFCVVCRSTRCDLIQRFCYCPFITPKYYRGHWLGKYLSTEKLPLARRRRKNKNEISCGRKTSTAWIFFVCSTPHVGSRPLAWIIQTKHVYLQMPKVPHVCRREGKAWQTVNHEVVSGSHAVCDLTFLKKSAPRAKGGAAAVSCLLKRCSQITGHSCKNELCKTMYASSKKREK